MQRSLCSWRNKNISSRMGQVRITTQEPGRDLRIESVERSTTSSDPEIDEIHDTVHGWWNGPHPAMTDTREAAD
jgi:hypothetical protein